MEEGHGDMDNNEDLDPRIQEELNLLNTSSNDINRLENEIDEARAQYRVTFTDASQKMEAHGKELKKYIQRARQFYQLKEAAVQAQSEALRAARQYQTANGIYRAAKETIALAEQKLMDDQSAAMLSSAWQEMLNHATIRVMEAEREKTRSEEEHLKRSGIFANLESKLQYLEKKFKTSIAKSRPYFEMKAQLEVKLQQQKQNIDDLQNAILASKHQYTESLKRLEDISEEIHESRRQKILLMYPRQPGVGADNESIASTISDPNIERGIFSTSSNMEDHVDSEIDESDEVFSSDGHVTSDSNNSSGISLSQLDKALPVCQQTKHTSLEAPVNPTTSLEERQSLTLPLNVNNETEKCENVNGESTSCNRKDSESACATEERECGSGAEQSPVCGEHAQQFKLTGCDVSLPERDENQTEGSSDPEECTKDLKNADIDQNNDSSVEQVAVQ